MGTTVNSNITQAYDSKNQIKNAVSNVGDSIIEYDAYSNVAVRDRSIEVTQLAFGNMQSLKECLQTQADNIAKIGAEFAAADARISNMLSIL
ncbi:MAG: TIGR04197 family type VII secretion effector [Lachnospiraceae bacterium]|nr:TIGR04197 family type VII secretion effector [Lachnospiraceae bacterium]